MKTIKRACKNEHVHESDEVTRVEVTCLEVTCLEVTLHGPPVK